MNTSLQTANDITTIASMNNATVVGVLLLITIVFAITIVYLYKRVEKLNSDFISEVKAFNQTLIKSNNSYNEFVKNMIDINHNK